MIYDKTRALEPGYYDQFEMVYKPALENDRKDAERLRFCLENPNLAGLIFFEATNPDSKIPGSVSEYVIFSIDEEMEIARPFTEPLLVAPPVTKGNAELNKGLDQSLKDSFDKIFYKEMLNHVVDDYDLTSNDTRRGD